MFSPLYRVKHDHDRHRHSIL